MSAPFRVLTGILDETMRTSVNKLLLSFSPEIFHAETEEEALAFLTASDGTDLIVLDEAWQNLPVQILCETARAANPGASPYCILAMNQTESAEALQALEAGADVVIQKPIDAPQFLSACKTGQRLAKLAQTSHPAPEKPEEAAPENNQEHELEEKATPSNGFSTKVTLPPALTATKRIIKTVLNDTDETSPDSPLFDSRPPLVKQMEKALKETINGLGIDKKEIHSAPATEVPAHDFFGWQGVFLPPSREWVDILFYFNRATVESLVQLSRQGKTDTDAALELGVVRFLKNLQVVYKKIHGVGLDASATLFCPPIAFLSAQQSTEAGTATYSQFLKASSIQLHTDFFFGPGTPQIKTIERLAPGDVLNEAVASAHQDRIALANRGVVITSEHMKMIHYQMKPDRTFWVIEPSALTRRLNK